MATSSTTRSEALQVPGGQIYYEVPGSGPVLLWIVGDDGVPGGERILDLPEGRGVCQTARHHVPGVSLPNLSMLVVHATRNAT